MKSHVVDVRVVDIQRKRLSDKQKHYVYALRVTWSDGAVFCIYRKYSMFFEFQAKLYEIFPYTQDSGIPAIPAKIFGRVQILSAEKKAKKIENFCQALIKLPAVISKCDDVLGFFEAWPEDTEVKLNKGDLKTNPFYAVTSPSDGSDPAPLYQDVDGVMEVEHELESYRAIAAFLGRGPNEIPLEMGQIVHVIDKNENGWWLIQVGEKEGRAPGSYLEPVEQAQLQQQHLEDIQEEVVESYKAVADYHPADQDEMRLEEGAEVHVLEKNFDGWWKVKCKGKIGFAPSTYLRRCSHKQSLHRDIEDIYALPMKPPPRRGSAERSKSGMFEVKRQVSTDDGGYVVMGGQERRRSSGASGASGDVFNDSGRSSAEEVKRHQLRRQHDSCTSLERNVKLVLQDYSDPSGSLTVRRGEAVQVSKHDESGWSYILLLGTAIPGRASEGWIPTSIVESDLPSPSAGGPPSLSFSVAEEDAVMGDESSSVYIAVEDYESRDPNASMSFAKGERVTVLEKKESGWWFVRIDDCEGWVPGAFFEPVSVQPGLPSALLIQKRFTAPDIEENVDSPLRLTAPSDPTVSQEGNQLLNPSKSLAGNRCTSSPQLSKNETRPSQPPALSPRMSRKPMPSSPSGDKFDLMNQVWYHGSLSRHDAEAVLLNHGKDREFLVRESPNRVGNYAISITLENKARHFPVETKDGKLYFGQHYYDKMSEIVKYYQIHPLFYIENIGIMLGMPVRCGR
ncbi:SH3 and PX domain-containing protein 2B-like isoform X2 [Oscarella lobularis]|uniref:SH3 and PX domain-containing protein 2B-like isoform X2 n=1 Tax=Oscarella lobularis TaxID=121494 RepID=UPI0033135C6C